MSSCNPAARRRAVAHPDQLLLSFEDLDGFEPPDRRPVAAVDARTAAPMSARPGVEGRAADEHPGKADPGRRRAGTMDATHSAGRLNPDRGRPGIPPRTDGAGRAEADVAQAARSFIRRFGPPLGYLVAAAAVVLLSLAVAIVFGCTPHEAAGIALALASAVGVLARGATTGEG